jgi:hypothetical protein
MADEKCPLDLEQEHRYNRNLRRNVYIVDVNPSLVIVREAVSRKSNGDSFGVRGQSLKRSHCCFWIGWSCKAGRSGTWGHNGRIEGGVLMYIQECEMVFCCFGPLAVSPPLHEHLRVFFPRVDGTSG